MTPLCLDEVREVMFERPVLDFPLVAIGVAVVVVPLPIALVKPLLVLPLELVVQDDTFDLWVAFVQALRDAQVRRINLRVMFKLPLAFEAGVELLARVLVATSMGFEEVPATATSHRPSSRTV